LNRDETYNSIERERTCGFHVVSTGSYQHTCGLSTSRTFLFAAVQESISVIFVSQKI